jgi:hypothetical protein
MPIVEDTANRLVLKSGSTKLTLDKSTGNVALDRKILFWNAKPANSNLSEVAEVTIDSGVDRASGIEVCNTMLVFRGGQAWVLPATDKKDAEASAAKIREFLKLPA